MNEFEGHNKAWNLNSICLSNENLMTVLCFSHPSIYILHKFMSVNFLMLTVKPFLLLFWYDPLWSLRLGMAMPLAREDSTAAGIWKRWICPLWKLIARYGGGKGRGFREGYFSGGGGNSNNTKPLCHDTMTLPLCTINKTVHCYVPVNCNVHISVLSLLWPPKIEAGISVYRANKTRTNCNIKINKNNKKTIKKSL